MSGSVTVYFSWGGTAIDGIDYTSPGYSVVFGDQQTTATVTPKLLDDDGFGEPDEELSLELEAGGDYDVGSPSYADVTITEDDDSMGDSLMLNLPPRETGSQPAPITPAEVRPYLQAAAREWETAGIDPAFLRRRIAGATVHVADLPGSLLGITNGDEIWLDDNAAGYGWYVDRTPRYAGAFAMADGPSERIALPGSPAYGHADLLTAVTHEVAHLLGLPDLPPGVEPQDVMALTIGLSTRRFPAPEPIACCSRTVMKGRMPTRRERRRLTASCRRKRRRVSKIRSSNRRSRSTSWEPRYAASAEANPTRVVFFSMRRRWSTGASSRIFLTATPGSSARWKAQRRWESCERFASTSRRPRLRISWRCNITARRG